MLARFRNKIIGKIIGAPLADVAAGIQPHSELDIYKIYADVVKIEFETETDFDTIIDQIATKLDKALELTHSEDGRLIASRLYDYLRDLKNLYQRYYLPWTRDKDTWRDSVIQIILLKNNLDSLIPLAGFDTLDKNFLNDFKKLDQEIQSHLKQEDEAAHIHKINKASYISQIAYYASIAANHAARGLQYFFQTLPKLLTWLGTIFPQVIIALSAAKNLFDIFYSIAIYAHLSHQAKNAHSNSTLAMAETYERGIHYRMFGNVMSLFLNTLILLAFTATLLATPIGWILTTLGAAAGWVTKSAVPAWQARKNFSDLKEKAPADLDLQIAALESEQKKTNLSEEKTEQLKQLLDVRTQLNDAKKQSQDKTREALWALLPIIGSMLFVAGFLFPPLPLFIVGIAVLGIAPARSVAYGIYGLACSLHTRWTKRKFTFDPKEEVDAPKNPVKRTADIVVALNTNIATPTPAASLPVDQPSAVIHEPKINLSPVRFHGLQVDKQPAVIQELKKTRSPVRFHGLPLNLPEPALASPGNLSLYAPESKRS